MRRMTDTSQGCDLPDLFDLLSAPYPISHPMKKLLCFSLLLNLVFLTDSLAQDAPADQGGGSLSGVVFQDVNKNAIKDESEGGSSAVVVELLDEDGEFIARVVTGEDGTYSFDGLGDGVYFLRFEFNAGFGVRSEGIEVGGGGDVLFTPIPFLYPNSVYNFVRLNLSNPASFRGEEVSSFKP